jgi:hypothetical protein
MKKRLLFLLYCAFSFSASSQVNIQWQKRYSSSGANSDKAEDMVMDASGNIYVTGVARGTSGTLDYVTIKYNSAGVQQWLAEYNGIGNGLDEAHAIAIDASGNNIYVTGWSLGDTTTGFDYATIKYNSAGVKQWTARYNNTGVNGTDEAFDIGVDNAGNVYVTGTSDGSTGTSAATTIKYNSAGVQQIARRYTGSGGVNAATAINVSPSAGIVYVTGYAYQGTAADFNFVTIKYNGAVTQKWAVQYNGPASKYDEARALAIDATGNVYVTGFSQTAVPDNYDYSTVKYDSTGVQKWAKNYNGTGNDYDRANAIKVDAGSNVYVTGRSVGTGSNADDILTIKYDKLGNTKWTARYNSPSNNADEGKAIAVDVARNVYVTGYTFTNGLSNDYVTLKYDSTGVQQWVTNYNGTGNNADLAAALLLDNSGNVFVTGSSKGAGSLEDYETIKYCQFTANAGNDVSICPGASTNLSASASGAVSYSWTPTTGLNNAAIANPVATPSTTTSYVVAVTNGSGCVDMDTVVVTVVPLPTPAISTSGPTTFCFGNSVKLTSIAAPFYKWSTSPTDTLQTITVSTTGTYSVTIKNSIGCSGTKSISVTVNPLPTVDAGLNASTCSNKKIQLAATGAVTYAWSPSQTLSDSAIVNPLANPTVTTSYTVTGSNANGCKNKDSVKITVLATPLVDAGADTSICKNTTIQLKGKIGNTCVWHPGKGLNDSTLANPTIAPQTTTTYTLITTASNGCSDTDTVRILVLALPTISAGMDQSICKTTTVQFHATGGINYIWRPGATLTDSMIYNPIANPSVTTTYTLTGISDVGCKSNDTIIITVLPLPAIPTITQKGDTLICPSGYFAYQWYLNNVSIPGATGPILKYLSNGTYYVSVSNNTGCSSNSAEITVHDVGIKENNTSFSVSLFPNPAKDEVTLELNLLKTENLIVNIINAAGQKIYSTQLKQVSGLYRKLLNLKESPNGIYYLQIISDDAMISKKIIKQE